MAAYNDPSLHSDSGGEEHQPQHQIWPRIGDSQWTRPSSPLAVPGNGDTIRLTGPLASSAHQMPAADSPASQADHDELEYRVSARTAELNIAISKLVQEIADHRASEAKLRQSEERFARAFHASPSATSITSLVDGRFIDANEKYLALTGYSVSEMVGRTTMDLNLWVDPKQRAELLTLIREEGGVNDVETQLRTRSGEIRDVTWSIESITINGEPCLLAQATDITERKADERKLREYAQSQAALLNQLLYAQEAERRRLMMDLHDGPLQSLSVCLMALDLVPKGHEREGKGSGVRVRGSEGDERIDSGSGLQLLRSQLAEAIAELRAVLADLSLEALSSYGLTHALRSHIERFSALTGIKTDLRGSLRRRLPAGLDLLFYRLAQEALGNVRKHAGAKNVTINIKMANDALRMTVTDDGRGFDVDHAMQPRKDGERVGLLSMQQRIQALGGDMKITSAPGKGTKLEFWCPVTQLTTGFLSAHGYLPTV